MADPQEGRGVDDISRQSSQLFVRRSTGLVREASALDATIFNAVFSRRSGNPRVGGVLRADRVPRLGPGLRDALVVRAEHPDPDHDVAAGVLDAEDRRRLRLGQPDPLASRGDRLEPRCRVLSGHRCHVLGAILPGVRRRPRAGRRSERSSTATRWSRRAPTSRPTRVGSSLGGMVMILWMTAILISGTKATFRWQNTFWFIASAGTLIAFVVLLFSSKSSFQHHFNSISHHYGAKGNAFQSVINDAHAQHIHPHAFGGATTPAIFVVDDVHDLELVERLSVRRAQERVEPQPADVDHVRGIELERDRTRGRAAAAVQGDRLPVHRRCQHRAERRLRAADRAVLPLLRGVVGQ